MDINASLTLVAMVLLFTFFLLAVLSIYLSRCVESDPTTRSPMTARRTLNQNMGLDTDIIDTFPVLVYLEVKHLKAGKEPLECAICLSEFDDTETLRLIPKCDHAFHPDCIDAWLAFHVTCPVCRAVLTAHGRSHRWPVLATEAAQENGVPEAAVVIHVEDDPTNRGPLRHSGEIGNGSCCRNSSSSTSTDATRKIPRSHSTGHSLCQPGENTERYTLRLPDELRRRLAEPGSLNGSRSSHVAFPRSVGSSLWKSSRDGAWWNTLAFSVKSPFVSHAGTLRSPTVRADSAGDSSVRSSQGFSVRSHFGSRAGSVESPAAGPYVAGEGSVRSPLSNLMRSPFPSRGESPAIGADLALEYSVHHPLRQAPFDGINQSTV